MVVLKKATRSKANKRLVKGIKTPAETSVKLPSEQSSDPTLQEWRLSLTLGLKDDLQDVEIEVPSIWREGLVADRIFPGECFFRALQYVIDLLVKRRDGCAGVSLVHGEYLGFYRHGWVELPGNIVFDGVLQKFYPKAAYYKRAGARPWYKYDAVAVPMIWANIPLGPDGLVHCGDWHTFLRLPWANFKAPTVINHTRAQELIVASGLGVRIWLGKLGAKAPDKWMSAVEWAKAVARHRMSFAFFDAECGSRPGKRSQRVAERFDAHVGVELATRTKRGIIALQIEKSEHWSEPRYRFATTLPSPSTSD